MAEEIEIKFIDIDYGDIKERLRKLRAKKVMEITYRKMFFDYPDLRFDKSHRWLRLRDEGEKIMLAYKSLDPGKRIEEVEIEVSNFDTTAELLLKLDFVQSYYMENKRERYKLGDMEFDLDTYPLIKPYLEIEVKSHPQMDEACRLLGLKRKDGMITSVDGVYKKYGIDLSKFKVLTFDRQEMRSNDI